VGDLRIAMYSAEARGRGLTVSPFVPVEVEATRSSLH
jgi:hypothetical protein